MTPKDARIRTPPKLARNGSRRVADPLAPRARVELRSREPRVLHGEQVVAGCHARAALVDNRARVARSQRRQDFLPERIRRLEAAAALEVSLEEAVDGARDVAGDRIERFVLAPEAVLASRIQNGPVGIPEV